MPDFGSLKKGITEKARQAAVQINQQVGQFPSRVDEQSDEASTAEAASSADIAEETGRLRAFIEKRRPAPGPVRGRWSIGIGDLLAEHPRMPAALRGLARQLDRYGGLAITETAIEFDHDKVDWSAVREIRTRNIVDYLLSDAVNQQLNTVPLPRFPGRAKLLDALTGAMLTLLIATAKQHVDRAEDIRIPAEVHYRGVIRQRELSPGILAALVLADPAVNECLHLTARAQGIAIRPAEDERMVDAQQRSALLRSRISEVERRLGRRTTKPDAGGEHIAVARTPASEVAGLVTDAAGRRYPFPDPGSTLVEMARSLAGDRGAEVVAAEVERVRRADGVLAASDVSEYKKDKDGPLNALRVLLEDEAMTVSVWAASGFSPFQKRSSSKHVEALCLQDGAAAAVDWALANSSNGRLDIDVLVRMFDRSLESTFMGTPVGQIIARILRDSLRKWR